MVYGAALNGIPLNGVPLNGIPLNGIPLNGRVETSPGLQRQRVCAPMVYRYGEGRRAVITFIDYSAAFDTESQLFLDSALADAGVSVKVRHPGDLCSSNRRRTHHTAKWR